MDKNNKNMPIMKRVSTPSVSSLKGENMRIPRTSAQARSAAGLFKGGNVRMAAPGTENTSQKQSKPLIRKLSSALFKR